MPFRARLLRTGATVESPVSLSGSLLEVIILFTTGLYIESSARSSLSDKRESVYTRRKKTLDEMIGI